MKPSDKEVAHPLPMWFSWKVISISSEKRTNRIDTSFETRWIKDDIDQHIFFHIVGLDRSYGISKDYFTCAIILVS